VQVFHVLIDHGYGFAETHRLEGYMVNAGGTLSTFAGHPRSNLLTAGPGSMEAGLKCKHVFTKSLSPLCSHMAPCTE
jgi:hypothetical protein